MMHTKSTYSKMWGISSPSSFVTVLLAVGFLSLAIFQSFSNFPVIGVQCDEDLGMYHQEAMNMPDETISDAEEMAAPNLPVEEFSLKYDVMSDEEKAALTSSQESHEYQAEVNRLMDIIINSLYTQKEVFLRELISNAADALEKLRIKSLGDDSMLKDLASLDIRVDADPESKTLSIHDSGIGMTKDDLINNLGTVAKSGTSNFLEALSKSGDVNLIGQFGVGFYAAFLVADRVTVVTKHADDDQYIWESTADASFSVAKDPRGNTLKRGTRITLHMKEDATEFLAEKKLSELVKRYSQFISYPILLRVSKTVSEDVPLTEEEIEAEEEKKRAEKEKGEEVSDEEKEKEEEEEKEEEKEDKLKTKKVDKTVMEWEQLNRQKAIWLRPKEEVSETEYKEFYKATSKDYSDPLVHTHFTAEGDAEFRAILYIPSRAPHDMFDNYFGKSHAIKLYVRRVLVSDTFEDLLPRYLFFISGVVDSNDLPLNVAREQLQQSNSMKMISRKIVRKVLDMMKKLMKDSEKERSQLEQQYNDEEDEEKKSSLKKKLDRDETKYDTFWKEFSRNMKLGCYEDDANRTRISKLLQFPTSKSKGKLVTLEKYVENLKIQQSAIYYASGESVEQIEASPQMQVFLKKGIEVLYLTESMDEPCLQKMTDFEGKKLESIQKGDVTLDETDDEKKRQKKLKKHYEPLLSFMTKELAGRVTKVEISKRLVTDPCAVVASQWGYSAQMEKVMKTQTFSDPRQFKMLMGMKTLEINPNHPVMIDLLKKVEANKDDPDVKTTTKILLDTALISSGFDVESPADLVSGVYKLVSSKLGLDPEEPVRELDVGPLDDDNETAEDDDNELEDVAADDEYIADLDEESIPDEAAEPEETETDQPVDTKDEL